jgi:uncharacterized membrane protein
MDPLLVRLLVGFLIVWLVQTLLSAFAVPQPTNKIVLAVTVVLVLLYILNVVSLVIR